jgi:hypothetical protein
MLNVIKPSVIMPSVVNQHVIMLSVVVLRHAECHYATRCFAECHCVKYHHAKSYYD